LYDLGKHEIELIPKEFLDLEIVKQGYGLPIQMKDNKLLIAVADPNATELEEVPFLTGLTVEHVLVEADKLREVIESVRGAITPKVTESLEENFDDADISAFAEKADVVSTRGIDDTPIVRYVNKILMEGVESKSSDIHFEPYESYYRIRYRQDGILHEVSNPPLELANSYVARIKVLANLNISEHRVPQDGRFKIDISKGHSIDFRISTLPTLHGEKVVLRILDPEATALDINTLGFEDFQKKQFLEAINAPQGIILVTGPTGSGKTISLYSALQILNTTNRNISTVEDPIEIYMEGINQVQVNLKTGMTFSTALRAFYIP